MPSRGWGMEAAFSFPLPWLRPGLRPLMGRSVGRECTGCCGGMSSNFLTRRTINSGAGRVRGLVKPVEKVCGQLVDPVLRADDGDGEDERSVGFPVDEAAAGFAVAGGLSDALGADDVGSDHLFLLRG